MTLTARSAASRLQVNRSSESPPPHRPPPTLTLGPPPPPPPPLPRPAPAHPRPPHLAAFIFLVGTAAAAVPCRASGWVVSAWVDWGRGTLGQRDGYSCRGAAAAGGGWSGRRAAGQLPAGAAGANGSAHHTHQAQEPYDHDEEGDWRRPHCVQGCSRAPDCAAR